FPARGIGARTIEQLQESAKLHNTTLWDAAARTGGKVSAFVGVIEKMRNDTRELPLPEIVDHVLQHSGLVPHFQNETGAKQREAQERLENLNELINAATMFVQENEDDSLTAFLTHAALEAGEHEAEAGADALHMMTVHAAKGLEFHTVFITGLEERLFPHQNSVNTDGGLDEERRLMYVALTRAKRRLYLTFAQSRMLHGQTQYGMVSSFLRELPDELLHWITPKLAQRNPYAASASVPSLSSFLASPAQARSSADFGRGERASAGEGLWHTGQRGFHQKFGEGVILALKGSGADGQVQVNFKRAGTKMLVLEYAKLTAI
ncbi:MAG: 3'-5' exonuclease, partial [Bryobacteraceae bacterium]